MSEDVAEVDIFNSCMVGIMSGDIAIMRPPIRPMKKDEALVFAAWIVSLADPIGDRFNSILDKVQNS